MRRENYTAFTVFLLVILLNCPLSLWSQLACPPNIGFESGDFTNWELSVGSILKADGSIVVDPTSTPWFSRHTLLDRSVGGTDPYGGFPINSPNGSKYSMRLGNDQVRAQAERVSFTINIPAGQDQYSIIYYYAVVFQDPHHMEYQQPKFTSKLFDVTADKYIDCGSYQFVAGPNLPGFQLSQQGTDIYYKPWSPISVNLSGYAGKTIRLEFTNNDCSEGGHFGYAYLDMNENCSEPITGNISCKGADRLTLSAPPGFREYQWFNEDFSVLLGSSATLPISPIPPEKTNYELRLVPFHGLGCIDTLTTTIKYSLVSLDLKLPPELDGCKDPGVNLMDIKLRTGSTPGMKYSYFSDENLAEPVLFADRIKESGKFYIQAMNDVGCTTSKPISVIIHPDPDFTVKDPPVVMYPKAVNIPAGVQGASLNFSYWKDEQATKTLSRPDSINIRGTYYVKAINIYGCVAVKPVIVTIDPSPEAVITAPNAFTPNDDGRNDVFRIMVNDRVKMNILRIYNRWGQMVYQTSDITAPWYAYKMPAGTYVWAFEGEDIFNRRKLKKTGYIVLLR